MSTITAGAWRKVKEANEARGFGLHDARHAPLSLSPSERAGITTAVGLVTTQANWTRTPYELESAVTAVIAASEVS